MNKQTLLVLSEIEKMTSTNLLEEDMTKGPKLDAEGVRKLFANVQISKGQLDNVIQTLNKIVHPGEEDVEMIYNERSGVIHDQEKIGAILSQIIEIIRTGYELQVLVSAHYDLDKSKPIIEQFKAAVNFNPETLLPRTEAPKLVGTPDSEKVDTSAE